MFIVEFSPIKFKNHRKPFTVCIFTEEFIHGADDRIQVILAIGYRGCGLYNT